VRFRGIRLGRVRSPWFLCCVALCEVRFGVVERMVLMPRVLRGRLRCQPWDCGCAWHTVFKLRRDIGIHRTGKDLRLISLRDYEVVLIATYILQHTKKKKVAEKYHELLP